MLSEQYEKIRNDQAPQQEVSLAELLESLVPDSSMVKVKYFDPRIPPRNSLLFLK